MLAFSPRLTEWAKMYGDIYSVRSYPTFPFSRVKLTCSIVAQVWSYPKHSHLEPEITSRVRRYARCNYL